MRFFKRLLFPAKCKLLFIAPLFATLITASTRASMEYQVVRFFGAVPNDGTMPLGKMIQGADQHFYGVTLFGGSNGVGSVFRLSDDGTNYNVLYSFGPFPGDAREPSAGVIQASDGFLYGTTSIGGTNGAGTVFETSGGGTVFRMATDGSGYVILHHFGAPGDGGDPEAALVEGSDGMLYGTTADGGTNQNGIVFKINKDGSGYVVLHEFGAIADDAATPISGLVEASDGALYGATLYGGINDSGAVFKLNKDGSNYSVLFKFGADATLGEQPRCDLVEGGDGALYGTASAGGIGGIEGFGTVFKVRTDGTGYSILHSFTSNEGLYPYAGLLLDKNGILHGTTLFNYTNLAGTTFKLNQDGTGYGVTHTFASDYSDGRGPRDALIQGKDGSVYGTASGGGINNGGTLFRLAFTVRIGAKFALFSRTQIAVETAC